MEPMEAIRKQRGLMTRIAAELRISRAAVSMWKAIPADRVPEVERVTGIPRHVLRSDLWEAPPASDEASA